ncbi:MAG: trehalose-phosphatase [Waddliaceae bacterium]
MKTVTLSAKKYRAVIFDLDGVVTKTADVHARAWKRLFDQFLKERSEEFNEPFIPFAEEKDYLSYVDGKPRAEGVKSFLESRGIELPLGSPDDSPDKQTVWGLGNKKNQFFVEELETRGVEAFPSTLQLIHELREEGIKVGIISSSKNCLPILKKLDIVDLFDTKIDGVDQEKEGITGKPAPDVFLEAAKRLGANASNSVVIEDAISGVQAGAAGHFSLVIGVDRQNQTEALRKEGADVVVKDLGEVSLEKRLRPKNAIEVEDELKEKLQGKKPAFFLDYDGTLTPIVAHADQAVLSDKMKRALIDLKKHFVVAVISGRDLGDVKKRVGIEGIFYAGSHGFDIEGPSKRYENREVEQFIDSLNQAEKELKEHLKEIDGAWVERKKYSLAVHFRQVESSKEKEVERVLDQVHAQFPDLRKTFGKKVFELQPNFPWDKGKALDWLVKALEIDEKAIIPVYLGDDVTDEDAFAALEDRGIGIAVHDESKATLASYVLKSPDEVMRFLQKVVEDQL